MLSLILLLGLFGHRTQTECRLMEIFPSGTPYATEWMSCEAAYKLAEEEDTPGVSYIVLHRTGKKKHWHYTASPVEYVPHPINGDENIKT